MAASTRLEKIKKARSLNDVISVIEDIAFDLKNSRAIVNKLVESLSAEIKFDSRDESNRPRAAVKVTKYVAPKVAELKKQTDLIHRLYQSTVDLTAAEAMIKQTFSDHKKQAATLKQVRGLIEEAEDQINDAFDILQEIADEHSPKELTKFVDSVTSHLLDVIDPKSYKEMYRQVYVAQDTDDKTLLQFSEYLEIEGFTTSSGYKFEKYYFIVTGVVNKEGEIHYFINSFPDFKLPGKYPLGKEVANLNQAKLRVDLLLAHNDFVVMHDKLPLPLDQEKTDAGRFNYIVGVDSANVVDDSLIVTLSEKASSEASVTRVVTAILAKLNGICRTNSNTLFTYKITSPGKGSKDARKKIRFILVPRGGKNVQKRTLNLNKLDEAAHMLDLSEEQKKALRFALQN